MTIPSVAVLSATPNFFSAGTYIYYSIPQNCRASLKIYNTAGQLVATLFDGELESGSYRIFWDSRDERNGLVKNGIYFVRLSAGDQSLTVKMTLAR
ncbi:T9SS type A sorting domain-containing protein [candidate division WOR-3 bacterium]|nr:T9SS type A sorting domain-containing protein [candidate division WOR-3 bacterium]